MAKPALGRGLGALLGGTPAPAPQPAPSTPPPPAPKPLPATPTDTRERVERVALSRVHPCPFQPRKDFAPAAIQELADSIREQGIVQPLIVRPQGDGFELIAGERRWRAAQLLGLKEIPVLVREADDRMVLELALIENLQRENLNPIEEALGYAQLSEQFQLTQEDVSLKVGKSRAAIANALRLLKLAPEVQTLLRDGQISVGHAKVILGLTTAAGQKSAAEKIIKDGLNVRQTEQLVVQLQAQSPASARPTPKGTAPARDLHIVDVERLLQEKLGTKVSLKYKQGKGSLDIRFFSDDELERILQLVGVNLD